MMTQAMPQLGRVNGDAVHGEQRGKGQQSAIIKRARAPELFGRCVGGSHGC
jgi:hypothetical protein